MEPRKVGGQYQFTKNESYQDYSSGRVLYGATGATNFPVRLVSEIFQRAKYYLKEHNFDGPYTIYDPFCGAAYSLTVLGLLHSKDIKSLYASDIDENILEIARKNLSLLTQNGLDKRTQELKALFNTYHKDSHKDALKSANTLSKQILDKDAVAHTYIHNAVNESNFPFDLSIVDLIITDIPYGRLTQWQGSNEAINPTQQFLNNVKGFTSQKILIAISMNKKQKATYEGYSKIKSFQIGTRKVVFLCSDKINL